MEISTKSQRRRKQLVVQLEDVSYYIPERIEYELPNNFPLPATVDWAPAVVLSLHDLPVDLTTIEEKLSELVARDDVFSEDFINDGYIILRGPPNTAFHLQTLTPTDTLKECSIRLMTLGTSLSEGPYFLVGRHLHQAWRLFPDTLAAFTTAVVPCHIATCHGEVSGDHKYETFFGTSFGDSTPCVAVPSRLYSKRSAEQSLSGLRITVKDNMHLSGVVTGLGSRAFAELYGKQKKTAEYVELLRSKGEIILGKTKLSAFAGSEVPPNQCIDYFPPWNPRGDGYQGPSGSSSGAGACVAGYDWVDAAVCTDTTGSLRFPASSHGTWGLKFTRGSVSMEGVVDHVPPYDTLGLLTRTPNVLRKCLAATGTGKSPKKPTRLLYPLDWFPLADERQQTMTDAFVEIMQQYLGVQVERMKIQDEWTTSGPEGLRETPLGDFLRHSMNVVNLWYGYHSFDDFRQEYHDEFGKPPYVSPTQDERWARGLKLTNTERDESLQTIRIFKDWFDQVIWRKVDQDQTTIMVVPQGRPGANYRDKVPSDGGRRSELNEIFVVSVLGCRQLIVPIGQNPYTSRVSERTEYAPIVTTLIGPDGSDSMLVAVAADALTKAGWPTTVLTGRLMFDVGDNCRSSSLGRRTEKECGSPQR